MKIVTFLTLVLIIFLWPARASADSQVVKEACAFTFEYKAMTELQAAIETKAKQLAVSELFGEVITALTTVEDFEVTGDTISSYMAGVVRVRSVEFFNGQNLGEVCVRVTVFITDSDRAQFEPVLITGRTCLADTSLSVAALRQRTRQAVLVQALVEYEPDLADVDQNRLLRMVQQITYGESDFLPGTETYCAAVEAYVLPVEITSLLAQDTSAPILPSTATRIPIRTPASPTTSIPTYTSTATLAVTSTATRSPASTSTATPTPSQMNGTTTAARPTARVTRTPTPTSTLTVQGAPAISDSSFTPPELIAPENNAKHYYRQITFKWRWPGDLPPGWGFEIRAWLAGEPHNAVVDAKTSVGIRPDGQGVYSQDVTLPPRLTEANWQWSVVVAQLNPFVPMSSEPVPFRISVDINHGTLTPTSTASPTPTTTTDASVPHNGPTDEPKNEPTREPTSAPTDEPTNEPTREPTSAPTDEPTNEPVDVPTSEPTPET